MPYIQPLDRLLALAEANNALVYGHFTLSSRTSSHYYFDSKNITLDPEGAYLISQILLPILNDAGAQVVGGPALGSIPIATALAMASHASPRPIPAFIVRDAQKAHGMKSAVDGHLWPGALAAVVDDVCTTGKSLLHAIDTVETAGGTVVAVLTLLDRQQGGSQEVRRRGYQFHSVFTANSRGRITSTSKGAPS